MAISASYPHHTRLLPEIPGWIAEEDTGFERHRGGGLLLLRTYRRGGMRAVVEITAGEWAESRVAQSMYLPIEQTADGATGMRCWLLRNRRANLVMHDGALDALSVTLRGGPGDLRGSVFLTIHGEGLAPDDAIGVALALDWEAITTTLAGHHPFDAARVAAATRPPPPPPSDQPRLWPMLPSLTVMERLSQLELERPPRFKIANIADLFPSDGKHCVAAMPTPILVLKEHGFAPDLIWSGFQFVSGRLRDALDLPPHTVEYGEVDTRGSADAARAADYKVLHAVHEADPVDLARMYGYEPDRDADGSLSTAWVLAHHGPHAAPRRTIWRDGFVPPAPLFRDTRGGLIATDALAERVMRAGLTDVMFQDVTSEASLHRIVTRVIADDGAG
ncbi:hypothetical protein ACBY01_12465 [Sphingomonas sp. ac-8]|uniref:hypothetical protein n=1 Tax=Sphingomonas sp. ac-8 TaxID=3242977 RepID=UPI003A7FD2ED